MNLSPEIERWLRRGLTSHEERARAVYLAMRPQIEAALAREYQRMQQQIASAPQVKAIRELKQMIREDRDRSAGRSRQERETGDPR